jgi:hypothetical protein
MAEQYQKFNHYIIFRETFFTIGFFYYFVYKMIQRSVEYKLIIVKLMIVKLMNRSILELN